MRAEEADQIREVPELPPRPRDAHKGTFGSVLVVAGSRGMSGAAALAGMAALHGGAGLVTVATPRSVAPIVAMMHPSYMTLWMSEDSAGRFAADVAEQLIARTPAPTAVAVGPGMGQAEGVRRVVFSLIERLAVPLVVDADGLNVLAQDVDVLRSRDPDAPLVLTPHPGEFSRLTGLPTTEIAARRTELAIQFARQHRVVLLLKGHRSIVTDGIRWFENRTGGPALATGGSGDVLTGLIAALLAQGMGPLEASCLATHLHGLAGEMMEQELTDRFATSRELVDYLRPAWRALSSRAS
ncbi:MAG: hypothetical protein KatS3mg111_1011 [Pirellulaceae bacterium]|nr:MAG: hypothetical protein KatS3mg111_1011 [Pirellulaceae bacterium]